MRKGLMIVTALAAGGMAAAPAWGRTPTATTAPPPPRAGTYTGHTSQGLRFSLRVAPSRRELATATFGFRIHCADRHSLQFTISPILAVQPWRLNTAGGSGFTRALRDTSGERYWIRGHFSGMTSVSGTFSTAWRSPHNGLCTSGRIRWRATLGGH